MSGFSDVGIARLARPLPPISKSTTTDEYECPILGTPQLLHINLNPKSRQGGVSFAKANDRFPSPALTLHPN